MKKHTSVLVIYLLLFVCGFLAPASYNRSFIIKEPKVVIKKVVPGRSALSEKKVEIIPADDISYYDSQYSQLSFGNESNVIKLLLADGDMESQLSDVINMDDYLRKNCIKGSNDLKTLNAGFSSYDQTMENMIFRIIKNSDNNLEDVVAKKYARLFVRYSRQYQVHPLLAVAVGWRESGFKPKAASYAGAVGIMQIMPITARELGIVNRQDPEQSIKGGVKYLHRQLKSYKDLRMALAAYNAGPAVIRRNANNERLISPYYRRTNKYIPHIEGFLRKQLVYIGIDPKVVDDIHFWLLT
ncbi:MAG: hypothetical protein DKM50_03325 [Candidatus Margulisiibacteriota bacterium]|nr:MAG: hypothetical protein A2X43_09465 [Candidatus Margulisbacteria bacterium GWD2_39_127]OGI02882.1 MAG: hypothetical protein A2X42_02300 [Candidatus Margulisbacteria bacterium GWF2_38_17]OGI06822.1 MAG: hypothetical protein A2X41_03680 [Candidatus Margulisbacteria bacterium GWE2_39_32]PZM83010.1 MAG: hypothetical protein DKM50_03325 [Candidatus Margulisiibacteriota bacterium]HAR62170.1 hypothetical protein [Candidatus Margulisiibacteriota bacterium]